MSDFQDRNSVAQAARVSGVGNLITSSTLLRWAIEGKVFEAGFGAEDTATSIEAALNDTTPAFSLQAPASSTLLVIPLVAKVALVTVGGAAHKVLLAFTKPAGLCATALTLSGTAFTSKHAVYRTSPPQTAQDALVLYNVTASALVAADYITYDYKIATAATLTTGLVALGEGPSNVQTWDFLEDGFPHLMSSGAAMLIYCSSDTTDAAAMSYLKWAEVTKDDLY